MSVRWRSGWKFGTMKGKWLILVKGLCSIAMFVYIPNVNPEQNLIYIYIRATPEALPRRCSVEGPHSWGASGTWTDVLIPIPHSNAKLSMTPFRSSRTDLYRAEVDMASLFNFVNGWCQSSNLTTLRVQSFYSSTPCSQRKNSQSHLRTVWHDPFESSLDRILGSFPTISRSPSSARRMKLCRNSSIGVTIVTHSFLDIMT